jgi:DNA anti-recombination protein RmuC
MKTYEKQNQEVQRLLERIKTKCENFAKQAESAYYGDLNQVISELHQIDQFLNDKYLTEQTKN